MDYKIQNLLPDEFPRSLREIPQPPKELHYIGSLPPREHIYLTVVGSRKYTRYGKDACESLIRGLAGYPITIVSGLALGIDTLAHETALEVGLNTIAFPGSGLDEQVIYPRSNWQLAQKIVEHGGCLISEFKNDTKAALWTFPSRNRLMAGISKAVLIIEAQEKSGTLITARMAVDYNRDVLVVPGSIFSENSKGTNQLITLGATPVTSSRDILQALGLEEKENTQHEIYGDLSDEERTILELLSEPITRDELIRRSSRDTQEINTLITMMELKGLVSEMFGEIRRM